MRQDLKDYQEFLLKKRKKARRRRFTKFFIFLIFIIVILSFTLYGIRNPSFFQNTVNKFKSFYTEESEKFTNSESKSESDTGENIEDETENQDGVSGGDETKAQTFWQRILAVLKIGMENQGGDFPSTLDIKVYFLPLGNEEKFVYEERTISAGSPQAALINAVNELLKGPAKSFNFPVIPPGTKLLSAEIYENFAKIDLSGEFLNRSLESGIFDEYVIYTIVNTVTQIPGIDGVIFSIEGKRIKVYGSVDLSIPAIRNEDFLNDEGQ